MTYEIKNKKILITGGCGSIGRNLIKKLIESSPDVIRIFDISEKGLYDIRQEFNDHPNIRYLLGDVRDRDRINRACEDIDIVIHAAALKHVYFCEYNPFEALKTNVLGTQNIIDAALDNNIEKLILTSSDKAVNPSNVMGMTKLLAERLCISANLYKGPRNTIFSCVRFGNVLGSKGSVIHTFFDQISNGGPVTITAPDMTRFIMTLDEASNFIIDSIIISQGGEIFISKMKALKVLDIAETMIDIYAKNQIDISIIGKSPGEKLYEELLTWEESQRTVETEKMYITLSEFSDILGLNNIGEYGSEPLKNAVLNSSKMPHLTKVKIKSLIKNALTK